MIAVKRFQRARVTAALVIVVLFGLAVRPLSTQVLRPRDFQPIAEEGFGDFHNNAAWSMIWWNSSLFVGTNRDWYCWSTASLVKAVPILSFLYPPVDPDFCTPDARDLPLQAEIWRWASATGDWIRAYQSPADVPILDDPQGRSSARDIGYRGMGLFPEDDGTGTTREVLYVGGVNSGPVNDGATPPRILRSTDGETFDEIPQDPGTEFGDLDKNSLRDIVEYNGKFYVVAGSVQGSGVLMESRTPAAGKGTFTQVTPPGMVIWDMAAYHGFLYVGAIQDQPGGGPRTGFSLLKTDATGSPPYTFVPVIVEGGYLTPEPSRSTVSMRVFNDRLYVGTDRPAELYRVNPDDTWDLVAGDPRTDPGGNLISPLSGIGPGFDWPFNIHLWRMGDYNGALYVGTADITSRYLNLPVIGPAIEPLAGFDLWGSADDVFWTPMTLNGFGDKFQVGVRTTASTAEGLFIGTASFHKGLQIWRGAAAAPTTTQITAPSRVEAEAVAGGVAVSWNLPPGATAFHVFRSSFQKPSDQLIATVKQQLGAANVSTEVTDEVLAFAPSPVIPTAPVKVGTTGDFYFLDTTAPGDVVNHYFVIAQDALGRLSTPSNVARGPSLAPPVTFNGALDLLRAFRRRGSPVKLAALRAVAERLANAREQVSAMQLKKATNSLTNLQQVILDSAKDDQLKQTAEIMVGRLARRVRLAQAGILATRDLN